MKILTYILIALLVASLGFGAFYYIKVHKPIAADSAKLKDVVNALDNAKAELMKYKDRDKERENRMKPVADALGAGLKEETAAGKAEVVSTENMVIVNIAEQALYTPGSVTFAKDGAALREKLASLLKDLKDMKDKDILVGNSTGPAPAQRKGRKKIPARDAIDVASDRSVAFVKFLMGKGVPKESLGAAAFSDKPADRGFKIKDHKTVVIISVAAAPRAESAAAAQTKPAQTPQTQQKPIPIKPAPPKTP